VDTNAPARTTKRPAQAHDYVLTGIYTMTMDDKLGNIPSARLHINNGAIVSIGPDDPAIPLEGNVLGGRGMVALPGFIDTHNHPWSGAFRSLTRDGRNGGYNQLKAELGPHFRPLDTYSFSILGLTEALSVGITTVHNWAYNRRALDHAEASVRA
jgi:5-methylthioadenosine/S-adenosylhomocysteine deaminase